MKRVGFDKKVKLDWLDQVAFSYKEYRDCQKTRREMDSYISGEVKGRDSRRKTLNVLLRIWGSVPEEHVKYRDQALEYLGKLNRSERIVLHWGMCLLAYTFFRDVTGIIGKILSIQENVSQAQVYRRVIERWGERSTVKYALPRLVLSLYDWGVLQKKGNAGEYGQGEKILIKDTEIKLWMLKCYLISNDNKAVLLESLYNTPNLFPFQYNLELMELAGCEELEVYRQGSGYDMVELR